MASDGTNFPPAENGQKVCAAQVFPTSTGEWTAGGVSDTATYWVLFDASTGDAWDYDELAEEVSVEEAGTVVTVQPGIFYGGQTVDES